MAEFKPGRGYLYSFQYHIEWCVKYRHKLLLRDIDKKLKEILNQIAKLMVSRFQKLKLIVTMFIS